MNLAKSVYGLGCLLMIHSFSCIKAQDTGSNPDSLRKSAVRFFLDCDECDINHIRREIPYVNYVRDVKEAQVYMLLTEREAGNSGREYTLMFEGLLDFAGMNDTLTFTSMPDDTDDLIRSRQLQLMKIGLMRYVARSPLYREIDIVHNIRLEEQEVRDRWNNWLFRLSFSPHFEGEETYKDLRFNNSLTVMKITEDWKLEFDLEHEYQQISYDYEDTSYTAFRNEEDLENLIVKSINEHWSFGGEINFRSSTFNNYKFQAEFLPAIEYNIFPYSQSTYRQLRILYGIGYSTNHYKDTTIYDRINEGLFIHSLRLGYEVIQKWGSIDISLESSNYLHDFSKNRIELGAHLDIRIVKGLSFSFFGQVARVRDQISLAKGELTEAEILLRLQEMATGYYYHAGIGLSYTFGSIYNNIVNPRFGND